MRYGGEFQLKQGFSPAFRVELSNDVEIGYHENYNDLIVVVSEDDLWYFEDHEVLVEKVDHEDEIVYSTTKKDHKYLIFTDIYGLIFIYSNRCVV